MTDTNYRQLLHDLEQLRSGDADVHDRAKRSAETAEQRLQQLQATADDQRDIITRVCGKLNAAVPDLRATGSSQQPIGEFDDELNTVQRSISGSTR